MAVIPGFLLRHRALISPKTGTGPTGDLYGPPAWVRCMPEHGRRKVRTTTGTEVVVSLTLYCRPTEHIPVGSTVEFEGRTTVVLHVEDMTGRGLPTPDHLEVMCQ